MNKRTADMPAEFEAPLKKLTVPVAVHLNTIMDFEALTLPHAVTHAPLDVAICAFPSVEKTSAENTNVENIVLNAKLKAENIMLNNMLNAMLADLKF